MSNLNSNVTMEELLASLQNKNLNLTRGQETEGTVVSIGDKEVTLDLGIKSEGVILIRDIPLVQLEAIKVGDKLNAFVLDPENESGQVVLTLQKSQPRFSRDQKSRTDRKEGVDPKVADTLWSKVGEKYTKDEIVKGTVTKITQIGVFVQLEEGIEGLMHISKLGPDDNFEPNQTLSVMIEGVDTEKRRISLAPVITSTKGLIYK